MVDKTPDAHPDEGALDPVWVPAHYPSFLISQTGSWRLVFGENNQAIGVVWTNHVGGTGVSWVKQDDSIETIRAHFSDYAKSGVPGEIAYQTVGDLPGVTLGAETSGSMQGVYDEMDDIMRDFD